MTLTQLRASLALWRRRNTYRQRKLGVAHARNDKKGIAKWEKLRREAGYMIERRLAQIAKVDNPRARIVAQAQLAAFNFQLNPGAYHYLAGGRANEVIMEPTPKGWRSDCSQFAVNVYREAGVPCPGTGSYAYSNTTSIAGSGRIVTSPKPGDLGLYSYSSSNPRTTTHHVEVYIGGGRYIGHGTRLIDGITPGLPTFFLSFIND